MLWVTPFPPHNWLVSEISILAVTPRGGVPLSALTSDLSFHVMQGLRNSLQNKAKRASI